MHTKTVKELMCFLRAGKVSFTELTTFFLQRIENYDIFLNSFITVDRKGSLKCSKNLDNTKNKKKEDFFCGVPYAQKDVFCTKGLKTTCASKMLSNYISPYDATVTIALKKRNFILIGKTNMDEFSMGSSGETSFYGVTRNPWNLNYVPGGSSSGSAASVAARLVPFALGSDTGGSVRQPASFCGITGFKPTYGSISRYGLIAFTSSLDQCGILAKTVEDCAYVFENLVFFDYKDSTNFCEKKNDYTSFLNKSIKCIRIGVLTESILKNISNECLDVFYNSLDVFRKLGCSITTVTIPSFDLSLSAYYVFSSIECCSNLLRYDGFRYGFFNKKNMEYSKNCVRTRTDGFGDEVKRRILLGTHLLTSTKNNHYEEAQLLQNNIIQDCVRLFKDIDVFLCPTTATAAFKLDEKCDAPLSMYLTDIFTTFVNLAGLPAISIPIGFTKNNLPVGAQLVCKHFNENLLFNVAHSYQNETDWHKYVPILFNN